MNSPAAVLTGEEGRANVVIPVDSASVPTTSVDTRNAAAGAGVRRRLPHSQGRNISGGSNTTNINHTNNSGGTHQGDTGPLNDEGGGGGAADGDDDGKHFNTPRKRRTGGGAWWDAAQRLLSRCWRVWCCDRIAAAAASSRWRRRRRSPPSLLCLATITVLGTVAVVALFLLLLWAAAVSFDGAGSGSPGDLLARVNTAMERWYYGVTPETDYEAADTALGDTFAAVVSEYASDAEAAARRATQLLSDFFGEADDPIEAAAPSDKRQPSSADARRALYFSQQMERVLGPRVTRTLFTRSPFRNENDGGESSRRAPPTPAYRHWISQLLLEEDPSRHQFFDDKPKKHHNNILLKDNFDTVAGVLDTAGAVFADFYATLIADPGLAAIYEEVTAAPSDATLARAARDVFHQSVRRIIRSNVDAMRLFCRAANLLLNDRLREYATAAAGTPSAVDGSGGRCDGAVSEHLRRHLNQNVLTNGVWVEVLLAHVRRRNAGTPAGAATLNRAVSYLALHSVLSSAAPACTTVHSALNDAVSGITRRAQRLFFSPAADSSRNALVLRAALQDPADHFTLRGSFFFTATPPSFTSCHSHYRPDESSEGGRFLCNEEYLAPTDEADTAPAAGAARLTAGDALREVSVVSAGSANAFGWEAGLLAFFQQQQHLGGTRARRVTQVLTLDCTLPEGLTAPDYLRGLAVFRHGQKGPEATTLSPDTNPLTPMELLPFCLGVGANNYAALAPNAGDGTGASIERDHPHVLRAALRRYNFTTVDDVLRVARAARENDAPSRRHLVIFKMDIEADDYRVLDNWVALHRRRRLYARATPTTQLPPPLPPPPEILMTELHSDYKRSNVFSMQQARVYNDGSAGPTQDPAATAEANALSTQWPRVSPADARLARQEVTHALLLHYRALAHLHGFGYLLHTVENNPQTAACAELTHSRAAYFVRSEMHVAASSLRRSSGSSGSSGAGHPTTFAAFLDAVTRDLLGVSYLQLFRGGVGRPESYESRSHEESGFQLFIMQELGAAVTGCYRRVRADPHLERLYSSLHDGAAPWKGRKATPSMRVQEQQNEKFEGEEQEQQRRREQKQQQRLLRFSLAVEKVVKTLAAATSAFLQLVYSSYNPTTPDRAFVKLMRLYEQYNDNAEESRTSTRHLHFDPLFMVLRELVAGEAGGAADNWMVSGRFGHDLGNMDKTFDACVRREEEEKKADAGGKRSGKLVGSAGGVAGGTTAAPPLTAPSGGTSPEQRCRARAVVPRKFSPQYKLRAGIPESFVSKFPYYQMVGKPSFLETFPITCRSVLPLITSAAEGPLRDRSSGGSVGGIGRDDTVVDVCNGEHLFFFSGAAGARGNSGGGGGGREGAIAPVVAVVEAPSAASPINPSHVSRRPPLLRWRASLFDARHHKIFFDYVSVAFHSQRGGATVAAAAERVQAAVCTLIKEQRRDSRNAHNTSTDGGYVFSALTLNLADAGTSEVAAAERLFELLRRQGGEGGGGGGSVAGLLAPECDDVEEVAEGTTRRFAGESAGTPLPPPPPLYLFPLVQFNMNFRNTHDESNGNLPAVRVAAKKLLNALLAGYLPYRTAALQVHTRQQTHLVHYRFFIESETDSVA